MIIFVGASALWFLRQLGEVVQHHHVVNTVVSTAVCSPCNQVCRVRVPQLYKIV